MSYLEFETVAMVDQYALERGFPDPDDLDMSEVVQKLKGMSKTRQSRSIGAQRSFEQMSLTTPVDTHSTYYTHVAVSNDTVVAATKDNVLHFFDQTNTIPMTSVAMAKSASGPGTPSGKTKGRPGDVVDRIMLDPMGRHCVVTTPSSAWYFHLKNGAKPKQFELKVTVEQGAKDFVTGCVGWDPNNTFEATSGEVLLGSRRSSTIVSTRFDSSGVSRQTKRVFEMPRDVAKTAIASIAVAPTSSEKSTSSKRIVLVAIELKLYYFIGSGNYDSVFDPFNDAEVLTNFISLEVPPNLSVAMRHHRASYVNIMTSRRHASLPPCFMWTYADRFVVQGIVDTETSAPPVAAAGTSPECPNPVRRTFEADAQQLVNDKPPAASLSIGLGRTAAAKQEADEHKVMSITGTYFYLAITTSRGVRLLAHPMCLPWRPLPAPTVAAPGLATAATAYMLQKQNSTISATSDESSAKQGDRYPRLTHRDVASRTVFEYALAVEQRKEEDDEDFSDLGATLTEKHKPTMHLRYKKDSACCVACDPRNGKLYVVHATAIVEASPTAVMKHQLLPLFLEFASRTKSKEKTTSSGPGQAFEMARCIAGTDKRLRRIVNRSQAEWLLANERYIEAAELLAEPSNRGTDDIIAVLSGLPTTEPLMAFIEKKISNIIRERKTFDEGQIELHCLCTWLVYLLMDQSNEDGIAAVQAALQKRSQPEMLQQAAGQAAEADEESPQNSAADRLGRLMEDQDDNLKWASLKEAIVSIGNEKETVIVCRAMSKFDEILEHFIIYKRYVEAVNLLIECCSSSQVFLPLWERHAHTLIQNVPVRLIRHGWIPLGGTVGFDPLKLIPALAFYQKSFNETPSMAAGRVPSSGVGGSMRGASSYQSADDLLDEGLDPEKPVDEQMAISYLRHVVDEENNTDEAIHNLLLRLLATDGGDEELVTFIRFSQYIDKSFALRVCTEHRRMPARVELYFQLGLLREAVQLALSSGDIVLAKETIKAIKPGIPGSGDNADKLRTELWETVIALVAKREGGPQNSLLLLSESSNDVNVSHVLPHFSDDVMICEFKKQLLLNVKSFGGLMSNVEKEIKQATEGSNSLRKDLDHEKNKHAKISSQRKCNVCGQLALSRSVVVFRGCGHVFHTSCYEAHRRVNGECFLCSTDYPQTYLNTPLRDQAKLDLSLH